MPGDEPVTTHTEKPSATSSADLFGAAQVAIGKAMAAVDRLHDAVPDPSHTVTIRHLTDASREVQRWERGDDAQG